MATLRLLGRDRLGRGCGPVRLARVEEEEGEDWG